MSIEWGRALACAAMVAVGSVEARGEAPVAASGPAPGAAQVEEAPATDHARVTGSVGFGWFGVSEIPLGELDQAVAAPAIGVRWWISERIGADLGIGLAILSDESSTAQDGATVFDRNGPSTVAFLLHLGAPIAVHAGRHYTLLVVPELNIGFGRSEVTSDQSGDVADPVTVERSGLRFDLGGRVGAEIQFGFIGIPELALEGSVGLFFTRLSARVEQGATVEEASSSQLTTTAFNSPWDFFRSSVAARYYF